MNTLFRCVFVAMVFFVASPAYGQITPIVARVDAREALQNQALPVGVVLNQSTGVSRVVLAYREFGQSEYRELEMLLAGRSATVTVPAEYVTPPFLEYYVRVEKDDGSFETYPLQNPQGNPLKFAVRETDPKDLEVRVLSPERGETVAIEDLAVVVSLYYASPAVDRAATKLFIDGIDVTGMTIFSDDLLLFSPQNLAQPLALGTHFLRVELFDTTGAAYHAIVEPFNVSTTAAIEEERTRLMANAQGQLELRNENVSENKTTYARGTIRATGGYGDLGFGGNLHLDNQDKPSRQPLNRFLLYGQTDWIRLMLGDAFPVFPNTIVSGKRVRGISGNLTLGFFNLDVAYGQTYRKVEGSLDSLVTLDSTAAAARPPNTKLVSDSTYAFFSSGTHSQNMLVVRPSFGSRENFQFGLTYLHAKDDVGSINYGTFPEENLVVGSDLFLGFDDQRFKWETQASVTVTNTDITNGSFSQEDYDSLKKQDKETGEDLERLGKQISRFFTVNENVFPTNPFGTDLPGLTLESILTLNYFNNYLQGYYFKRGSAYRSFGNDFIQADFEGFLVSDRVRLFENRVYLSLSYESKHDNTANNKAATTQYRNLNASVTVSPINLPAFTLGYGNFGRESDLNIFSPDSSKASKSADELTNRYFVGASYDFDFLARQSLTLNVSISDRKDATIYKRDQTNMYATANLTTRFIMPLQTVIGFSVNRNENTLQSFGSAGQDSSLIKDNFDYTTLFFSAQYRLLNDDLRLVANILPSIGDIQNVNIQIGADYAVFDRHSVELYFNYVKNKNIADDTIASLIYRFAF